MSKKFILGAVAVALAALMFDIGISTYGRGMQNSVSCSDKGPSLSGDQVSITDGPDGITLHADGRSLDCP